MLNIDTDDDMTDFSIQNSDRITSFNPWETFTMLQKIKKVLYVCITLIVVFVFASIALISVTISKMKSLDEIVLSSLALGFNIIVFTCAVILVGIFKEKEFIIPI